ncbi:MobP3 family relaxase [Hungatella hathewayi]|uniref:MobP3 family relaxase n=1 Tax=Hungatella hathewayi TaxID=154046 RepID=UPI0011DDFF6F|nr:MobP3 family relaxase [Hungatella hathewayi]
MPRLILRCNYLKNAPPSHLANYMNYISTREGVEKIDNTCGLLPATVKQKELIADILSKIEDADRMHEYYDYLQRPTRENATEFITQALENNLDIIAKKKNYIDYLANRPRVERIGTHGLFSNEGESVVLSRVAEEVANHPGVIWTNVISLRRKDAERLGYDSAVQWQALLRSRVELLCENYKIDSRNLKWYAAFHNESHHPHVHLVVYSTNPSEGYLSPKGIDTMRSTYAHDIFRQEFMSIYEKRTQQREQLKEQANKSLLFLLQQMQSGICHNEKITEQMQLLSKRLMNTGGKKVYGYLKADVKAIVNSIVNELAKEEKVSECYQKWLESKSEILHFYKDADAKQLPLSEQKELKSIKNMVIREAVRYGEGYLYTEDEGLEDLENEREKKDGADDLEVTEDMEEVSVDYFDDEPGSKETDGQEFYAKWTDAYKEAREYLYGTQECEPDEEAAYEIMKEEAEQRNAYAMADMGKMYAQGIFVEADKATAQEWYEKSLRAMLMVEDIKENTYLEYRIGKMYQYGLGTGENLPEAAKWFGMAASKEHKYALYSLGMLYLHGKGVEQDEGKACQLFQRSHKKGNPYASFELGKLYEAGSGTGTERNTDLAEKCYRVAFLGFLNLEKKSRDDTLWCRIGTMYLHGIGTEADEKEAEKYLRKSADYGNTHAAYQLAKLYIYQETEKLKTNPEEIPDYEKIKQALKWLVAASEQGNTFADYALGKLYADGELTAKDMEKAFHYLQRAADADNAYARYRLGRLYLSDEYKDIGKAVRYLTLAANQKNEFASYRLGKLYLVGEEVEKNIELAIRYLEESADAGNQYAQYVLGKVYLMGKEVEQDRERAYEYFRLAAEQGNVYAAYFLEHWNAMPHPDLLIMATRLMHHLEKIIEDDVSGKKGGRRSGMDRKLARKIKSKKIAQGHARDDREEMIHTQ